MTETPRSDLPPAVVPAVASAQPRLRDPATAAFIAFPLAMWCVSGIDSMWGLSQILSFTEALHSSNGDLEWDGVATMLLAAAFAFGVYLFARAGLSKGGEEALWWQLSLLRASMALAALTVVLRLIGAAVLVAAHFSDIL